MKIAMVSPLYESVPPKYYGGTERVVSFLTEELVRLGHEVTLFASGDSETSARLIPICQKSLRQDKDCIDPIAHHYLMVEKVHQMASEFDVIHFNIDYLHFLCTRHHHVPNLTTFHGRLDIPDLQNLFKEFSFMPVVSISNSQRRPVPFMNWQGTVYHGLPLDLFKFREKPGDYLVFLGRMSREKRPDRAIEIAKKAGMRLVMAAKIDKSDEEFYESTVKPMMNDPLIQYIGEIGEHEKDKILGNAYAMLFPIDWPEPFGMVMIESLACGTPVIAYPNGAVPEVLERGESGFIINSIEDGVRAVKEIPNISRRRCREIFEERFTAEIMAKNYIKIYERIQEAGWTATKRMSSELKINTTSSPLPL